MISYISSWVVTVEWILLNITDILLHLHTRILPDFNRCSIHHIPDINVLLTFIKPSSIRNNPIYRHLNIPI
jgi:hypothetical protein